ncbi:MAG: phospholipase/carboxylesterase [Burkholderiales bacterium]|jgi:phospholipase/carboxylesterase
MLYEARLHGRPTEVKEAAPTGLQPLRWGSKRDSYLYVPPRYNVREPAPLALMLHGSGGHAHQGIELLLHLADDAGLILVAPASTGHTWDIIIDQAYGPDVALVDQCLAYACDHYAVDPAHVAIGGFSDGASYGLSLGIANGDIFTHMIAFSPGFIAPAVQRGKPRVFISHGTDDPVLPVDACSRRIVAQLRSADYDVEYLEVNGGHEIPPTVAQASVDWFLATPARS